MTNSRAKGAAGELEAARYLESLGFADCSRTAQRWGKGKADVECPELDNVHIEVKYGYDRNALFPGSAIFRSACRQAEQDCDGKPWCVLWRVNRNKTWYLTFWVAEPYVITTTHGGPCIAAALKWLQEQEGPA